MIIDHFQSDDSGISHDVEDAILEYETTPEKNGLANLFGKDNPTATELKDMFDKWSRMHRFFSQDYENSKMCPPVNYQEYENQYKEYCKCVLERQMAYRDIPLDERVLIPSFL